MLWGVRLCCGVTHLGKATRGGPDRYGLSESLFLLCSVTLRLLPLSARRSRKQLGNLILMRVCGDTTARSRG